VIKLSVRVSQKTGKKPSARRPNNRASLSGLFWAPVRFPGGTKLLAPHFLHEAVTRRATRRVTRIAKGGRVFALHPRGTTGDRDKAVISRTSTSEYRNTATYVPTRHGRTRHRYRHRCVAHDHGSLHGTAERGQQVKPRGSLESRFRLSAPLPGKRRSRACLSRSCSASRWRAGARIRLARAKAPLSLSHRPQSRDTSNGPVHVRID
jgi:hypothetical protein